MQTTTSLSTKGQIVIPKKVRTQLGLKPNDRIVLTTERDRIIIQKTPQIEDMYGFITPKKDTGVAETEIQRIVRKKVRRKYSLE